MMKQCKHCGSRYPQGRGQGEFCCAGCEHVCQLIQDGGLGEYYSQQDRVGQPVGDRPFSSLDFVSIDQLQQQAENTSECQIAVTIKGMSCMGCAWLVEQLSGRHPSVRFAKVALDSSILSLGWKPGTFDLCALAEDLQKFGYRITGDVASAGYAVSPLTMRLGLTLVFSLNGLLLSVAAATGIGGEGLRQLYNLLIVVCLLFTLFIGGTVFLKPAWGALQLRRLHSDMVPALLLLALFALALASLLFSGLWVVSASLYFIVLSVMILARWLSDTMKRKWHLKETTPA
jgi:Cu2+-exporting ATPase